MNKKNLTISDSFNLAVQNQQKGNLKVAEDLYKEVLKKNPEHLSSHNNLGNVLLKLGKKQEAINCYLKVIEIKPDSEHAHFNLGNTLELMGQHQEAVSHYRKTIEINPNFVKAYINLGRILNELGKNNEAIQYIRKAISVNPNYPEAHNILGNLFKRLGKQDEAINSYKKATQIDSNYFIAYHNLAVLFRSIGDHKEAIKYFKKSNTHHSRAELLESTYFFYGLKTYKKMLEKLVEQEPLNIRVATMAAYVSKKKNINNIYPFCKDPLNCVFIKNLRNELTSANEFSENLSKTLGAMHIMWEPSSKSTIGGYHTSNKLFERTDAGILVLRELIEKQIIIYKETYKSREDYFITKWPLKSKIVGWHVKLIKQGYQKSHIHPAGWLSGVFYLKVPKFLDKNEGSIKLTLYGYDYPKDKNLPYLIYKPKEFDIILFPSSLFHQTIPFSSNQERHVIAFDLQPK